MGVDFNTNPLVSWALNISKFGLEYAASRYYGLYGGAVDDNADPQGQGRIRVKVPVVGHGQVDGAGGFNSNVHDRFAYPSSIYAGKDHGIYFPPEVGDAVYVSFDHGDSDVPRYHGSWWCNPDPSKASTGSHVPAEFRTAETPKKRGIKTGFGHGLIFCDEENAPYVALWSGKQVSNGGPAKRRQQITLSDADGVESVNGVDGKVDKGIYLNTTTGLRVELDDTNKSVLISGNPLDPAQLNRNEIKIEEKEGSKITVKTQGLEGLRHEITLDDTLSKISVLSKGKQSVIIDDLTGTMSVTATGALLMSAAGGIAMGSGAAPPAPSVPGASVETGAGTKLIDFAGLVTETVGSFVQNSASTIFNSTIFQVVGGIIQLGPAPTFGISISLLPFPFIIIGDTTAAKQLLTADLLDWLETHTHTGNLGGPTPLAAADALTLKDPSNPSFPNPLYVSNTLVS